jgi:2-amino-4-hydroxy-6-hydroxymethyldihydropteridine diphosphokinase
MRSRAEAAGAEWLPALIGLGSNRGDRESHLRAAVAALTGTEGVRRLEVSRLRETAPVGGPPQDPYLNGAARLETRLSPRELLAACLEIERREGRERSVRWGPRTIDLDLLLYADRVLGEADLVVPHPRLLERAFALEPAAEIAAGWVHPLSGRTLGDHWRELAARCGGGSP